MSVLKEQVRNIIDDKLPLVSNLSNVSAVLNTMEDLNWVGFYLAQGDKLYLGPFQGEPACTIINKGKGVCGTAFLKKQTIIVDDVDQFVGHIACSSLSKSEIVVPIIAEDEVVAVIDIDSPKLARFNIEIAKELEEIAVLLGKLFKNNTL